MDVGKCRGLVSCFEVIDFNIDLQKSGHPDRGHLCNEDAPAQNHYVNFAPMDWNYYILDKSYMLPVRPMDSLLIGICTIESWDLEKKSTGGLAKKLVFTHNIWPVYHEDIDDPCIAPRHHGWSAWTHSPRAGQCQACQTSDPDRQARTSRSPENATDATAPGAPGAPDTTCSSLSSLMSILKPFLKALKSCRVQRPPNTRGQLETMGNANGTQFGSAN